MNADTNICWVLIIHYDGQYDAARSMLHDAVLTSGVVEELLYRIYWEPLASSDRSLHTKDDLRDKAVKSIRGLYANHYLGGANKALIFFALDLFRYRRIDWVDAYLIARQVLLKETLVTFDSDMFKLGQVLKTTEGKIPVISGYTLPVDNLPGHVFVRAEDKKAFMRSGLLHLEDL